MTKNHQQERVLRVQTLVAGGDLGGLRQLLEGLDLAAAKLAGSSAFGPRQVGRVEWAIGDVAAEPALSATDVRSLADAAGALHAVTYELVDAHGGHDQLLERGPSDLLLVLDRAAYPAPWLLFELVRTFEDERIGIAQGRRIPLSYPEPFDPESGDTARARGDCLMIPIEILKQVGGFGQADGIRISERVKAQGWRIVTAPRATFFHHCLPRRDAEAQAPDADGEGVTAADLERRSDGPATGVFTVVLPISRRGSVTLRDGLAALAVQSVDDFQILVVANADEGAAADASSLINDLPRSFRDRIRLIEENAAGSRPRLLNAAIRHVQTAYVAFLDGAGLVTADWVQAFQQAADGSSIIRSWSRVRAMSDARTTSPATGTEGRETGLSSDPRFSFVRHLAENETPLSSVAVPAALIREHGMSFDEDLEPLHGWELLLRLVERAPVRETGIITTIVHQCELPSPAEMDIRRRVLDDLDRDRLILPAGSVCEVLALWERCKELGAEGVAARAGLTTTSAASAVPPAFDSWSDAYADPDAYESRARSWRWRATVAVSEVAGVLHRVRQSLSVIVRRAP